MSIFKAHTPAFKDQVASVVDEKFFNSIEAPKKELVWFKKSAHSACFEETESFNRLMVDMVLSTFCF